LGVGLAGWCPSLLRIRGFLVFFLTFALPLQYFWVMFLVCATPLIISGSFPGTVTIPYMIWILDIGHNNNDDDDQIVLLL